MSEIVCENHHTFIAALIISLSSFVTSTRVVIAWKPIVLVLFFPLILQLLIVSTVREFVKVEKKVWIIITLWV